MLNVCGWNIRVSHGGLELQSLRDRNVLCRCFNCMLMLSWDLFYQRHVLGLLCWDFFGLNRRKCLC